VPPPAFKTEIDALLAAIAVAFGDVGLGSGISLHQARELDNYATDERIASARDADPEIRWQDLSDEKIDRLNDALSFMGAAGFRFYLPRFMVWSLQHLESDSFAVDAPIYACDFSDDLRDHAESQYALLTVPQRQVIARFLRFFVDQPDAGGDSVVAASALRRFWSRYA
jgi:hypothetical protein